MQYPGIVSGTYQAKNPVAASERTVNWYVEPLPASGKNAACLLPIPGEKVFMLNTFSPGRALFEVGGRVFAVCGPDLVEVLSDGSRLHRYAALAPDPFPAVLLHNTDGGNQLFIVSGQQLYVMDLTVSAPAPVVTPGPVDDAAMVDGYILTLDRTDSTVYQSDKYSSLITGDAFFQRSAESDRWVAIARHEREVWVFGERTTEVWANDGGFPLAFAAIPAGRIAHGIAAPWSKCSVGGALLWLSQTAQGTGEVVLAAGLQARVVSDYSFAQKVQKYSRIDDAIGWAYQTDSHTWYVLEFPTERVTWAYDLTTKVWAERGEWDSAQGRYTEWRPRYHVYAFGKHLCLHGSTGDVLELDDATRTHASGNPIRLYREAPPLFSERKMVFYPQIEVHVETGLGTSTGQGVNPQMELLTSPNGGKTWRSQGTRSAGKQGEYGANLIWRRLGRADDFKVALVATDPVRWSVIDAYVEAVQ